MVKEPKQDPSLVSRIYNGLDQRKGFQVILTKPITFMAPPVAPKLPWWRRILGS